MPGNREAFSAAMNAADRHRWDSHWADALQAYQQAIAEFPDDITARSGLGFCQMQLKHWQQALDEYSYILKSDPGNIIALSKTAELFGILNRREEAYQAYLQLADIYAQVGQGARAEAAWQKAVQLSSSRPEPHERLASYYFERKDIAQMIQQRLAAAQAYLQQQNREAARLQCEEVLRADGTNTQAYHLLMQINGSDHSQNHSSSSSADISFQTSYNPTDENAGPPINKVRETTTGPGTFPDQPASDSMTSGNSSGGKSGIMGNMGSAGNYDGMGPQNRITASQVTEALQQAQVYQNQGRFNDAIDLCEQILESGFDRPDARYFLGWLYQEQQRWDEAIQQFQCLLNDPDYALSCYYSLGQCYRARGDLRTATVHFDEAVDRVNLDALTAEESDQLLQLCQEAAEAHRLLGEVDQALTVYNALLGFLKSRGWSDKVAQVEFMLQQAQSAPLPSSSQAAPSSSSFEQQLNDDIQEAPTMAFDASTMAPAQQPGNPAGTPQPAPTSTAGDLPDWLTGILNDEKTVQPNKPTASSANTVAPVTQQPPAPVQPVAPPEQPVATTAPSWLTDDVKPNATRVLSPEQDPFAISASAQPAAPQAPAQPVQPVVPPQAPVQPPVQTVNYAAQAQMPVSPVQPAQPVQPVEPVAYSTQVPSQPLPPVQPVQSAPPVQPYPTVPTQPSVDISALVQQIPQAPVQPIPQVPPQSPDQSAFALLTGNLPPVQAYAPQQKPGLEDLLNQIAGNQATGLDNVAEAVLASTAMLPENVRMQVVRSMQDIQKYINHGLLTPAMEECLKVINIAPQYLDVHQILCEIYVRQGKLEQAVTKYAILVDTYIANGRLDDAIAMYRRILQLEPNNLTYRMRLINLLSSQGQKEDLLRERTLAAESYLRLGYVDRAMTELEQALQENPTSVSTRLNYALALQKLGRTQQAVAEYQRVLQVDPRNLTALLRWHIAMITVLNTSRSTSLEVLSRIRWQLRGEGQRNAENVIREYLQALDIYPNNADVHFALGQVYQQSGQYDRALDSYLLATRDNAVEVFARSSAAQVLFAQGRPEPAIQHLENALSIVKRNPGLIEPATWAARPREEGEEHQAPEIEISTQLAKAYGRTGRQEQMQAILRQIKQGHTSHNEVTSALADIPHRHSDPATALQEYLDLVRHYRQNKQLDNAINTLNEMVRFAPQDPRAHAELADIYVLRGHLDEGIAEFRLLADLYLRQGKLDEAGNAIQRIGNIYAEMGDNEEALSSLFRAAELNRNSMDLLREVVGFCLQLGRNQDAARYQLEIARHYFETHQVKETVAALQQLITIDRTNYEAYDMLGQTYQSVGEYEQASRVYRNLAKVNPGNATARERLATLQELRTAQ